MKRTIYFIMLLFFYSNGILLANETVALVKSASSIPQQPSRAPAINRTIVMVTYDGTELALNFSAPVGMATVTLTDEMGGTRYQETIDTNATSGFYIPVGGFDSGNYTVVVHYGSTQLSGIIAL